MSGSCGVEFARDANGAVGAVGRIGINNVGAIGLQNALALNGNIFRHAQRDRKSLRGADHGVSDAGVAAGGIEQNFPGTEFSAGASLATMFDAARSFTDPPGLYHSALPSKLDSGQVASETLQAQQWSIADELEASPAERLTRGRLGRGFRGRCRGESGTSVDLVETGCMDPD